MHAKSPLRGNWGCGKPPFVAIPQMVIFLIFAFIAYLLGDLPKIKKIPKNIQNHPFVVIGGPDAIFLLIFRPYTLCDLRKIKYQKSAREITPSWRLGVWTNLFRTYFLKKNASKVTKKVHFS